MLQFFRKYQKVFFVVITFVIVISFSFFGTHSHISPEKDKLEDKATKTISGSKITLKQIKLLSFFLDHDPDDERLSNFLNDFILQKDIFETPIGTELAKHYFPFIEQELKNTFERVKAYRSYRHPSLDFFSSEMVWNQYLPQMNETLTKLKKADKINAEYFENLCKAYILQKQFSPQLMKSILIQTQNQQRWIEPDLSLPQRDFHLFGFRCASDWFGTSFIDLVSEFILNISSLVEKTGQGATFDQAKIEMYKQFLQKMQKATNIEKKELSKLFDQQLAQLQLTEKQVVGFWQNILNVRYYFQSMQTNMLLDQKMWPCMLEKAVIEEYHLPKYLQFHTFQDVLKFDMYLKSVFDLKRLPSKLTLPTKYLSQANISKHYPELIERRFTLNVKEITKEALKANVPIKSLLKWQLDHWQELGNKYAFINKELSSKKTRFEHLQRLNKQDRHALDEYVKEQIVLENPSWIEDLLKQQQSVKKEIGISLNHQRSDFVGVSDYQKLKAYLLSRKDQTSFQVFTDNEEAYYTFEVEWVSEKDEIMTFERALQTGAINVVLHRVLEEHYEKLKKKSPLKFQNQDKQFKPYKEVVDQVGLDFFEEIYSQLDKKFMKKGQGLLDFYASARLVHHLQTVKEKNQKIGIPFSEQFPVIKNERILTDKENVYKEAFRLPEENFSDVVIDEKGPAFFKLIKKESLIDQEYLDNTQKMLSEELLRKSVQEIILKMQQIDV